MKTTSSIENKKLQLIRWISTTEDYTIIQKILDMKERDYEYLKESIFINEEKSIDEGLKDAEAGKLNPHSDVIKRYEKWL